MPAGKTKCNKPTDESQTPAKMSKLALVDSVVNAKNKVLVTSHAKKCKNTTVVAESGVNDDDTLSETSEESVKVLAVERVGQSRK